jgi:hypothetical protein
VKVILNNINEGMTRLMDAPASVRTFVCKLYSDDRIKGPLWKVYETQTYDPATGTVLIDGVSFRVEEK